jgi:ParB family chromosome partitioning protein
MRTIEMIPVDKIQVLNPRVRNRRTHQEIIENIRKIGLKRPITVSRRNGSKGDPKYDLVCGQGRLEAFQQLGHAAIPAFVVTAKEESCLLMSLVENIARRQHSGIELMREIGSLHERGYSDPEIAGKLGVTPSWVGMVVGLLVNGEERLVSAVESGLIPISLAVVISRSDDAGIQEALAEAYTHGNLRGKKLALLKRLLEQRAAHGKLTRKTYVGKKQAKKLTAAQLVKTLEREVAKNALLEFVAIMKAEGVDTLPKPLETRMASRGLQ